MSLYNTTNIKNLPQVDQIIDTDFLIVENYSGTNKLKFKDFVVGPTNTSFYNPIKTSLSELSAYDKTLTTTLCSVSTISFNNINTLFIDISGINGAIEEISTKTLSAVNDLTFNFTVTSQNLINQQNRFIESANRNLGTFLNLLYEFRWHLSASNRSGVVAYDGSINRITSIETFNIDWPTQLKDRDVVAVRPYYNLYNTTGYRGTVLFSLSTVYFNGINAPSTYALLLTSTEPVPDEMCYRSYFYPGTTKIDNTKTFCLKIVTSTSIPDKFGAGVTEVQ